jgi:hypothetical protein
MYYYLSYSKFCRHCAELCVVNQVATTKITDTEDKFVHMNLTIKYVYAILSPTWKNLTILEKDDMDLWTPSACTITDSPHTCPVKAELTKTQTVSQITCKIDETQGTWCSCLSMLQSFFHFIAKSYLYCLLKSEVRYTLWNINTESSKCCYTVINHKFYSCLLHDCHKALLWFPVKTDLFQSIKRRDLRNPQCHY